MRYLVAALVLLPMTAWAQIGRPNEKEYIADVGLVVGQKQLDSDDWGDDLATQTAFGLEATWAVTEWKVGIASDLLYSRGSVKKNGTEAIGSTTDFSFGARKIFVFDRIRPHVGGGVSYTAASVTLREGSVEVAESATGFGPWASGGILFRATKSMNVGASVRYSSVRTKGDFSKKIEAGGLVYGLVIGFGTPGYEPEGTGGMPPSHF